MSVARISSRIPETAERSETVFVAARRMHARNVGTLIVVDADRRPVGIVTDRDLVVRVMAAGRDPRDTTVEQAMTAQLRMLSENASVEDALATMRSLGIRRMPVVDRSGRLVGVMSADDAFGHFVEELGNLSRVFAWSQTGSTVPVAVGVDASRRRGKRTSAAGLERGLSDPEC